MDQFYKIALKRNEILTNNALTKINSDGSNIGVIVVGGFHVQGILELLRSKGISYDLIMPNVGEDFFTTKSIYTNRIKEQAKWMGLDAASENFLVQPQMSANKFVPAAFVPKNVIALMPLSSQGIPISQEVGREHIGNLYRAGFSQKEISKFLDTIGVKVEGFEDKIAFEEFIQNAWRTFEQVTMSSFGRISESFRKLFLEKRNVVEAIESLRKTPDEMIENAHREFNLEVREGLAVMQRLQQGAEKASRDMHDYPIIIVPILDNTMEVQTVFNSATKSFITTLPPRLFLIFVILYQTFGVDYFNNFVLQYFGHELLEARIDPTLSIEQRHGQAMLQARTDARVPNHNIEFDQIMPMIVRLYDNFRVNPQIIAAEFRRVVTPAVASPTVASPSSSSSLPAIALSLAVPALPTVIEEKRIKISRSYSTGSNFVWQVIQRELRRIKGFDSRDNTISFRGKKYRFISDGQPFDFTQPCFTIAKPDNLDEKTEIILFDPNDVGQRRELNQEFSRLMSIINLRQIDSFEDISNFILAVCNYSFNNGGSLPDSLFVESFVQEYSRANNSSIRVDGKNVPVVPLTAFMTANVGVCRHQVFLAAYLLDRLVKTLELNVEISPAKKDILRALLGGQNSLVYCSIDLGHTWAMYVTEEGQQVYDVDSSLGINSPLEEIKSGEHMPITTLRNMIEVYQRPEDLEKFYFDYFRDIESNTQKFDEEIFLDSFLIDEGDSAQLFLNQKVFEALQKYVDLSRTDPVKYPYLTLTLKSLFYNGHTNNLVEQRFALIQLRQADDKIIGICRLIHDGIGRVESEAQNAREKAAKMRLSPPPAPSKPAPISSAPSERRTSPPAPSSLLSARELAEMLAALQLPAPLSSEQAERQTPPPAPLMVTPPQVAPVAVRGEILIGSRVRFTGAGGDSIVREGIVQNLPLEGGDRYRILVGENNFFIPRERLTLIEAPAPLSSEPFERQPPPPSPGMVNSPQVAPPAPLIVTPPTVTPTVLAPASPQEKILGIWSRSRLRESSAQAPQTITPSAPTSVSVSAAALLAPSAPVPSVPEVVSPVQVARRSPVEITRSNLEDIRIIIVRNERVAQVRTELQLYGMQHPNMKSFISGLAKLTSKQAIEERLATVVPISLIGPEAAGRLASSFDFVASRAADLGAKLADGLFTVLEPVVPVGWVLQYQDLQAKAELRAEVVKQSAFLTERNAQGTTLKAVHEMPEMLQIMEKLLPEAKYLDLLGRMRSHEEREIAGESHAALLAADPELKDFMENVYPSLDRLLNMETITEADLNFVRESLVKISRYTGKGDQDIIKAIPVLRQFFSVQREDIEYEIDLSTIGGSQDIFVRLVGVGLLDRNGMWIGGRSKVVFKKDFRTDGVELNKQIEIEKAIFRLSKQASAKGGQVAQVFGEQAFNYLRGRTDGELGSVLKDVIKSGVGRVLYQKLNGKILSGFGEISTIPGLERLMPLVCELLGKTAGIAATTAEVINAVNLIFFTYQMSKDSMDLGALIAAEEGAAVSLPALSSIVNLSPEAARELSRFGINEAMVKNLLGSAVMIYGTTGILASLKASATVEVSAEAIRIEQEAHLRAVGVIKSIRQADGFVAEVVLDNSGETSNVRFTAPPVLLLLENGLSVWHNIIEGLNEGVHFIAGVPMNVPMLNLIYDISELVSTFITKNMDTGMDAARQLVAAKALAAAA